VYRLLVLLPGLPPALDKPSHLGTWLRSIHGLNQFTAESLRNRRCASDMGHYRILIFGEGQFLDPSGQESDDRLAAREASKARRRIPSGVGPRPNRDSAGAHGASGLCPTHVSHKDRASSRNIPVNRFIQGE